MASQSEKEKIIETILKLSKITSEDSGAFEGEVANASAMMQKLMDKYTISVSDLEMAKAKEETREMELEFASKPSDFITFTIVKWHWDLARTIARITHTQSYATSGWSSEGVFKTTETRSRATNKHKRNRYWTIAFFGTPENREIACDLFLEWVLKLDEMARDATKTAVKSGEFSEYGIEAREDKIYRRSWIDGCIHGINMKLNDQENQRTKEMSSAIVLFQKDLWKAYREFSTGFKKLGGSSSSAFSPSGYAAGKRTGESLSIGAKPLSPGGGRKLLKG